MHAGGDEDGFVAGAADLEEDKALALELNFLVVDLPRQDHRPVSTEKVVAREAVRRRDLAVADGRSLHGRSDYSSLRAPRAAGRML